MSYAAYAQFSAFLKEFATGISASGGKAICSLSKHKVPFVMRITLMRFQLICKMLRQQRTTHKQQQKQRQQEHCQILISSGL